MFSLSLSILSRDSKKKQPYIVFSPLETKYIEIVRMIEGTFLHVLLDLNSDFFKKI